jgi:hypothetical protein
MTFKSAHTKNAAMIAIEMVASGSANREFIWNTSG